MSPVLHRRVVSRIIGHDDEVVAFVNCDEIAQFRAELEIQCVRSLIAFDESNCSVRFLELDETVIAHMGAVLGVKYDQLRLVCRQFQQRNPEISDILAVDQIMFHIVIPGRSALRIIQHEGFPAQVCEKTGPKVFRN